MYNSRVNLQIDRFQQQQKKKPVTKKVNTRWKKKERESFKSFINRKKKKKWLARLLYILKTVCGGVELAALLRGSSRLINLFTWKTRNMVDISSNVHTEKKMMIPISLVFFPLDVYQPHQLLSTKQKRRVC